MKTATTILAILISNILLAQTITFTSTSTFTVSGTATATIECWAGGGGGGYSMASGGGAGGGGGGTYSKVVVVLTSGITYTATVGAGGAGGQQAACVAIAGAVNGGDSYFASPSSTLVKTTGGQAGASSTTATYAAGGISSTALNIGTTFFNGGSGFTPTSARAGSGGGGAGSGGNGSNGTTGGGGAGGIIGTGGSAGGNGGNGSTFGSANGGSVLGGGGAGGYWNGGQCRGGGAGARGQIKITYVLQPPLPIELLSFDGVYNNGSVNITWSTASEINNDFFTVERSTDGVDFIIVGTVYSKALNGNSTSVLSYTINDPNTEPGVYYYRLKQTDYDGKNETFNVVSVIIKDTHIPTVIKIINMSGQDAQTTDKGILIYFYDNGTSKKYFNN